MLFLFNLTPTTFVHLKAEETHGSRTAAPLGIVFTCFATGVVGLGYLLALLYVTTDIHAALNGATGEGIVDIFVSVGGSAFGSAMSWLIVINLFFAGMPSPEYYTI